MVLLLCLGSSLTMGCAKQKLILKGRITAPDGVTPVPYGAIWFKDQPTLRAETDVTGHFTLEDVPAGLQSVYVQKGVFQSLSSVEIENNVANMDLTTEAAIPFAPDAAKLAVFEGRNDQIEQMISSLGFNYTILDESKIESLSTLQAYDVVFLNCGMAYTYAEAMDSTKTTASSVLRDYINGGGRLYVSDNAMFYTDVPFSSYYTKLASTGTVGGVTNPGNILDARFQAYMETSRFDITIDLWGQRVLDTVSDAVYMFMRGPVTAITGSSTSQTVLDNRPLLGSFTYGKGKVLFSLFHLNKQGSSSDNVKRTMVYMIFDL